MSALIYRGEVELTRQIPLAAGPSRQAIELAERHGWTDDPFAGLAYMTFGSALAWQGRLDEADAWVQRAERTIVADDRPVVAMGIKYLRGQLELGCGQPAVALAAFEAGEPLELDEPLVIDPAFWNAPFGAARTCRQIGTVAEAVAFFRDGRAKVRAYRAAISTRRTR